MDPHEPQANVKRLPSTSDSPGCGPRPGLRAGLRRPRHGPMPQSRAARRPPPSRTAARPAAGGHRYAAARRKLAGCADQYPRPYARSARRLRLYPPTAARPGSVRRGPRPPARRRSPRSSRRHRRAATALRHGMKRSTRALAGSGPSDAGSGPPVTATTSTSSPAKPGQRRPDQLVGAGRDGSLIDQDHRTAMQPAPATGLVAIRPGRPAVAAGRQSAGGAADRCAGSPTRVC